MEQLIGWLKAQTDAGFELNASDIPERLMPVLVALREKIEQAAKKESELSALLAFYKASANAMPNPIFIKDEQLRFVFFNRAYQEFFGIKEHEYLGKRVLDLEYIPEEDRQRYHAEDYQMMMAQGVRQYEKLFHRPDQNLDVDSLYWSKGFKVPETGQFGVVGEIVDISKEKTLQRKLARSMQTLEDLMEDAKLASKTDPGTKLYNRQALADEVPALIHQIKTDHRSLCAMFVDIDYFKQINDTYGHLYGDEILEKIAKILKRSFRQNDMAIRYGGDEFAVILPDARLSQAESVAARICNSIRNEVLLPDGKGVTLSIGVAELQPQDTLVTLLDRTDEALYQAKRGGRNRVATKA